jgi:hypothetical protein
MSTNERYAPRQRLSLPVANSTAAGTPVRIVPSGGSYSATDNVQLNGVTETATGAAGEAAPGHKTGYASVALDGTFNLAVGTTTAITVGGPVYITSGGALTPVSTSNALFGHVVDRAKGTTAGEVVPVRIKN